MCAKRGRQHFEKQNNIVGNFNRNLKTLESDWQISPGSTTGNESETVCSWLKHSVQITMTFCERAVSVTVSYQPEHESRADFTFNAPQLQTHRHTYRHITLQSKNH